MNNKQISKIAAATKTSTSTVSKVLNHCYGVSGDVRERIFQETDRIIGSDRAKNQVSIYVIVPEVPGFFWNCELSRPQNPNISIKYNVYSRLGDHNTVIRYLKEAVNVDADAIIIVAQLNKEIEATIRKLADEKLIIFLTEYHNTINTFYVGSDASEDGKKLATSCLKHHLGTQKLLIIRDILPSHSNTSLLRLEAFKETLHGQIDYDIVDIRVQIGVPSFSSAMAVELYPLFKKCPYSSVVSLNGFTHSLCSAVQKMKLPYQVKCFGFENSPQNQKWAELGYLKAAVCQNFSEQFSAALKIAEHYIETKNCPERKYTFVESNLIEYR